MKATALRAVIATAFSLQSLVAQLEVTFPSQGKSGESKAIVIPTEEAGLYATVGVVGADVRQGKAADGSFELVAQDPQSRVTLLKSEVGGKALTIGSSASLKPGSALYRAAGKKGGLCRVVSWEGTFHDQPLPLKFLRIHYTGTVPAPGQPLFDENGALVAVAHQPSGDFGNGTYALPIEAVVRNISDFKKHQSLRRCWLGLLLDHVNTAPVVVGVRPDSPASAVGLKKGDILLSIGGREITDYSSAIDAFYYLIPNEKVACKVLRGTQLLTVELTPKPHPSYELQKRPAAEQKAE